MTFGRPSIGLASRTLIGLLHFASGCHSVDSGGPSGAGGTGSAIMADAAVHSVSSGDAGRGDDEGTTDGVSMPSSGAVESGAAESEATEDAASSEGEGETDAGVSESDSGGAGDASDPCAARAGLVFCDTFEAATAPLSAPWSTSIIGGGTVTVDSTTPAHSGIKSIHVSDGDADYDTLLVLHSTSVLPAPAGRFYVRAFVRLGSAMSAGHNTLILADLFASQGQGNNLRLGEDYQMLMYTVMGDAHGALSNANYYNDGMLPGIQFTADTWTCLEVLLDSKKPEIDVWVGGMEIPDLHHTDFPLDDYDNLRFGFEKYAGPALDVWYDDIAVGTQPIGCD